VKRLAIILLFLQGCGTSEVDKLIAEMEPVFENIAREKMERAEYLMSRALYYHVKKDFRIRPENQHHADLKTAEQIHRVAKRFIIYADSVKQTSPGRGLPKALVSKYRTVIDSLFLLYPADEKKVFANYDSLYESSLDLSIALMKCDVAANEILILSKLLDENVARAIHDDFSMPYATPLSFDRNSHTFALHYNFGQTIPANIRDIGIETMLRDGIRIRPQYTITDKDLVGIVGIDSVEPGTYLITGVIKASTPDQVEERSFQHSFVIK
jgi:hypothetical protein